MKTFIKNYWKILLFFTVVGLVGGYFVGIYQLDNYPAEIKQQVLEQGISESTLGLISAVQSAGYGLILGAIGIFFAKKVGLWRDKLEFVPKPLALTAVSAIVGGMLIILPDILFFGDYSQIIRDSYLIKPSIAFMIASVTYGGVIEEVMLRLFFMSIISFGLHKIFEKGKQDTSVAVLIAANIVSALLFAVGHLPATLLTIGSSPVIILRCFLLNGSMGLIFGWLYRKYGLQYAMLAHGGCHVVSKLIWILFL